MAIDLTAIATSAEYYDLNGKAGATRTDDATLVDSLLTTVTRVVERRVGVAPGMLKPQTSLTFTFSGDGCDTLYLRDERGFQYLLRAITADSLKIDSDGDGDFDYTYDSADAWVRLMPYNAATFGEPYTCIELDSARSGAGLYTFPDYDGNIEITGNWGWAATPGALKNRVIQMTRELMDSVRAGASMNVYAVEDAITRTPTSMALLRLCEQEFNYRIPAF